jgi:hypothetical protein
LHFMGFFIYHYCYYYNIFTNTQEVNTQSAAPSRCIHSSKQKCGMDRTSTSRQTITSTYRAKLLHTFICRHVHASPEAGATGLSQHANRCSICTEVRPTQTHTQLSQSAIHKRGPRDTPWADSLVSKQMQELHRWLAKATVRLYGEGYEAVAMRLHSCICSPLKLVPMGCRRSSRGSRPGDDV